MYIYMLCVYCAIAMRYKNRKLSKYASDIVLVNGSDRLIRSIIGHIHLLSAFIALYIALHYI